MNNYERYNVLIFIVYSGRHRQENDSRGRQMEYDNGGTDSVRHNSGEHQIENNVFG